ncbi:hypothetical protein [Methanosphaera sp.]
MSNETFDKFTKSLSNFITNNQELSPPILVGYIVAVSDDRRYCNVHITAGAAEGELTELPCKGFPVIGDTVTVLFIGNSYENGIVDCPRALPIPEEDLISYYSSGCYNYLDNGDFTNKENGFTGDFSIFEGDSYTSTNEYSCQLTENGKKIIAKVDLTNCNSDYFKFQCYYKGMGTLNIYCYDTDTKEVIKTLPYSLSSTSKNWISEGGRFTWNFNKETYPRVENDGTIHEHVTIVITNVSDEEETSDEIVFTSMLLDGLLVYDENSNEQYYSSVNDVMEN